MKRTIFIFLLSGFLCLLFISGCTKKIQESPDEKSQVPSGLSDAQKKLPQQQDAIVYDDEFDDKFIVATPFDLTQVSEISKFRSCVGHDYSGFNANGEREMQRSMKHYLNGINSVIGSGDKVKVYAPFDGKITYIDEDFASFEGKQRGQQVWLSGKSTDGWVFVFFHINLLGPIQKDTNVKAGQHIGYANLENSPNFDITLKKFGFFGPNTIESPFLHMSPEVVKQYSDGGLKFEELTISKSERDAEPCSCTGEYCSFPSTSPESNPEDWAVVG
ncbi:hypothetical protein HYS47_04095 [Candidatus Woesearchaeota archaeon]|nr:hypothetical protein [Candidatus Woesearchaeota archaeon]